MNKTYRSNWDRVNRVHHIPLLRRIRSALLLNVAGLSTKVAEQLIPTWTKFNGKTTVLSPATL